MDALDRDKLMKLFRAHTQAEANRDLDGVMDTICAEPVYEWYPMGYRLTDRAALREYYRLCFDTNGRSDITGLSASFGNDPNPPEDLFWWGEKNSMIARDELSRVDEHGVRRSMKHYTVWQLEGDLLLGETVLTTKFGGEVFMPILDHLVATYPGVTRLVC